MRGHLVFLKGTTSFNISQHLSQWWRRPSWLEPTLSIFLVCAILLWMVCGFPIIYMKDDPHIYLDHLCFFSSCMIMIHLQITWELLMSVIMITIIIIINISWNSIKCSTASLLTKQRLDLQRSGVIDHLIGQLQRHRTSLLLPTDFKELEAQCVSTREIQVGKFTFP